MNLVVVTFLDWRALITYSVNLVVVFLIIRQILNKAECYTKKKTTRINIRMNIILDLYNNGANVGPKTDVLRK